MYVRMRRGNAYDSCLNFLIVMFGAMSVFSMIKYHSLKADFAVKPVRKYSLCSIESVSSRGKWVTCFCSGKPVVKLIDECLCFNPRTPAEISCFCAERYERMQTSNSGQ